MAMSPLLKNGCELRIAFTGRSPALRGMGCSSCHIRNVSDPRFVQSLLNDPPPPHLNRLSRQARGTGDLVSPRPEDTRRLHY